MTKKTNDRLSDEQLKLLDLIGAGLSVAAAAQRLRIPLRTAERRLAQARAALGATTNAQAVLRARGNMRMPDHHVLTRRERQVLELVAEGLRDEQIADRLEIARATVATLLRSAMARLGVRNRTQAAAKLAEMVCDREDAKMRPWTHGV